MGSWREERVKSDDLPRGRNIPGGGLEEIDDWLEVERNPRRGRKPGRLAVERVIPNALLDFRARTKRVGDNTRHLEPHTSGLISAPRCRTTFRNQPDDILKPARKLGVLEAPLV